MYDLDVGSAILLIAVMHVDSCTSQDVSRCSKFVRFPGSGLV